MYYDCFLRSLLYYSFRWIWSLLNVVSCSLCYCLYSTMVNVVVLFSALEINLNLNLLITLLPVKKLIVYCPFISKSTRIFGAWSEHISLLIQMRLECNIMDWGFIFNWKQQKLKTSWWIWSLQTCSVSLLKTLIDGLECCGLLWCFYQQFELSFWRHPFTAEDPLVSKWCNAKLFSFSLRKATMTWKWFKWFQSFWVIYSFSNTLFHSSGIGKSGCRTEDEHPLPSLKTKRVLNSDWRPSVSIEIEILTFWFFSLWADSSFINMIMLSWLRLFQSSITLELLLH